MFDELAPVGEEEEEALGRSCEFDPFLIITRIAVHEAGHHVASYLLGRRATSELTIAAGGLAAPCTFYPANRTVADVDRSPRELTELRAVAMLAGAAAEAVIAPAEPRPASTADQRIATEIVAATVTSSGDTETITAMLRGQSEGLFGTVRARGAVLALADALLDAEAIPATDALSIITSILYGPEANVPTTLRDRGPNVETDDSPVCRRRRFVDTGMTLRG